MNNEKYSIVIIDDETEILNVLSRFLTRNPDFSVSTYSNPISALSSLGNSKVDLVLLDIMMPQMNGLDVLKELHAKYPTLKVIMMTAYSTLDKVLNSHREGATHYVMKPFFSMKSLEEKIYEIVK